MDFVIVVMTRGLYISGITISSIKHRHVDPCNPKIISYASLFHEPISFKEGDLQKEVHPHHDAFVISILLANFKVKRILVDTGSSTNILFIEAVKQMQIYEAAITKKKVPLIGFSGEKTWTFEKVILQSTLRV